MIKRWSSARQRLAGPRQRAADLRVRDSRPPDPPTCPQAGKPRIHRHL